jgi:hypothetical protein
MQGMITRSRSQPRVGSGRGLGSTIHRGQSATSKIRPQVVHRTGFTLFPASIVRVSGEHQWFLGVGLIRLFNSAIHPKCKVILGAESRSNRLCGKVTVEQYTRLKAATRTEIYVTFHSLFRYPVNAFLLFSTWVIRRPFLSFNTALMDIKDPIFRAAMLLPIEVA